MPGVFKKTLNRITALVFTMTIIVIFDTANHGQSQRIGKLPTYPFSPGEKISYKVNYSIFTVGKAEVILSPVIYKMAGKKYYRLDINGKTAGAAHLVTEVNDNWGALLDTTSLLSHRSWRNLAEGRYRRREFVDYDHVNGKLNVNVIDNNTGRLKEPKLYEIKHSPTHDMISGYLWLRMINYENLEKGDTIQVYGFLEDTFYDLKILYMGKEEINTRLGSIMTHKLVPIMPKNGLFSGENSIIAWLSADELRIPVRIHAKMFIGHVGCEITGVEGTRMYPDFIED